MDFKRQMIEIVKAKSYQFENENSEYYRELWKDLHRKYSSSFSFLKLDNELLPFKNYLAYKTKNPNQVFIFHLYKSYQIKKSIYHFETKELLEIDYSILNFLYYYPSMIVEFIISFGVDSIIMTINKNDVSE